MPTRPGITVYPLRSSAFAPSGTGVLAELPRARIRAVLNYHGLVLGRGSAGPVDHSNVLESDQGSIDAHEAFDRIGKLGLRKKSFGPKHQSHGQNQRP